MVELEDCQHRGDRGQGAILLTPDVDSTHLPIFESSELEVLCVGHFIDICNFSGISQHHPKQFERKSLLLRDLVQKNACVHAKSLRSCLTLCDPMDSRPPGSSVHRILQARILEWVAISFSKVCHI